MRGLLKTKFCSGSKLILVVLYLDGPSTLRHIGEVLGMEGYMSYRTILTRQLQPMIDRGLVIKTRVRGHGDVYELSYASSSRERTREERASA